MSNEPFGEAKSPAAYPTAGTGGLGVYATPLKRRKTLAAKCLLGYGLGGDMVTGRYINDNHLERVIVGV